FGSLLSCWDIDELPKLCNSGNLATSNDAQAPYRLLPDTGHLCVGRSGGRYVHVTGATATRNFLSLRYKSEAFGFYGAFFTKSADRRQCRLTARMRPLQGRDGSSILLAATKL